MVPFQAFVFLLISNGESRLPFWDQAFINRIIPSTDGAEIGWEPVSPVAMSVPK